MSLSMFDTILINQLLTPPDPDKFSEFGQQQLSLFSKRWDTTDFTTEVISVFIFN
jgi:hypothetical protein